VIPSGQNELFQVELARLVDQAAPLVKLGREISWAVFEKPLGRKFDGKTGAPEINTRLIVALDYLEYQSKLSDEALVTRWVENPLWQQM